MFSCIWTRKNSVFGHFPRSEFQLALRFLLKQGLWVLIISCIIFFVVDEINLTSLAIPKDVNLQGREKAILTGFSLTNLLKFLEHISETKMRQLQSCQCHFHRCNLFLKFLTLLSLIILAFLKALWQIYKKRCSEKYCSCVEACQFSALYGTPWRSYLEKTDNWRQIYKQTSWSFCTSNDVYKRCWKGKIVMTLWSSHFC